MSQAEIIEKILGGVVDAVTDAVIVTDDDYCVVLYNAGAQSIFGRLGTQVIGRSVDELLPGLLPASDRAAGSHLAAAQDVRCVRSCTALRANGEPVAVQARISSQYLDARRAFTIVLHESCGRQQSLSSAALLATIVESSYDAMIVEDLQGIVHGWNNGAQVMFGYPASEMLGSPVTRIIPPQRRAEEAQMLARIRKGERVEQFETVRCRKDGSLLPVLLHVSPVKDVHGNVIGASKVTRDISARKQREELLRESEQRWRAVMDSLSEGLIIVALDEEVLFKNSAALKMFELERSVSAKVYSHELAATFEMQTLDGLVVPYRHWPIPRILRGEAVHDLTLRARKRGTQWQRIFQYSGAITSDSAGNPVAFLTMIDISQRHAAEIALRESEERYRQIVEAAQEGIWQVDAQGDTTFVNARMAELLGYAPQEMLGASVFSFMDAADRPAAAARMQLHRAASCDQHDFKLRRKDGGEIWMLISTNPLLDGYGHYVGTLGLFTDITERKHAEAQLRESDARFRQLAESLPQLVWTCGVDGASDFLSRQWEQYTGVSCEQQLGYGWHERVHPDDREMLVRDWQAAVASHSTFHSEIRLRRHDGRYHWFDTRATPLLDAQGRVTKWFGSNTDINDRKQKQESQLRTQKMEALGTLAGGIAHDFNNILLAITGNSRLAMADLPAAHPARESLAEIDKASVRAADLVRRILAFSRQEEMKRDTIDLRPAVEEALKLLRSTLPAMIELRTDFAAALPAVIADTTQVHQIIMNLTTNSFHAIGQRPGVIELKLQLVHLGADQVHAMSGVREGEYVMLVVSDNGCGMDQETMERVFDPFFTTKPPGSGTGLGLSVVDGIVKSHGGAITLDSQPGKGTTIRLFFPAVAASRMSQPQEPRDTKPAQGERVLYVDDDEALVYLATRTLAKLGYEVTGCSHPQEAVERFRSHPRNFDVVITDLSMPGMSGFDLARELAAVRPGIPIIVTSGYVRPEDQEIARGLEIRALILKPNTINELGGTLDRLLRPRSEK